jgi:hypothetical protein
MMATLPNPNQRNIHDLTPKRELRFLRRSTLDVLANMQKVLELNSVELHQPGEDIIHELFNQFFAHYALKDQTNMVNLWAVLLSPRTNLPDQLVSIISTKPTNAAELSLFNTVKRFSDCISMAKLKLISLEVMTCKLPTYAPAIISHVDILYKKISGMMVSKILGKHPRYGYPVTLEGTISLVEKHIREISNGIAHLFEPIYLEYDAGSSAYPYNEPFNNLGVAYIFSRLLPEHMMKDLIGDFPKIIHLLRTLCKSKPGSFLYVDMRDNINHVFSREQYNVFLQYHHEISRLIRCLIFNGVDSIAWLSELLFHPTCHIKLDYDQFANAKHYTSTTFTELLRALDNFAVILYRVIIRILTQPADLRISGTTAMTKAVIPLRPNGSMIPPPSSRAGIHMPMPPAPPGGGGPSVPPGPSGVFPGAGMSMPPAPPGPPSMFPGAGIPPAPSSTPGIPTSGVVLPSAKMASRITPEVMSPGAVLVDTPLVVAARVSSPEDTTRSLGDIAAEVIHPTVEISTGSSPTVDPIEDTPQKMVSDSIIDANDVIMVVQRETRDLNVRFNCICAKYIHKLPYASNACNLWAILSDWNDALKFCLSPYEKKEDGILRSQELIAEFTNEDKAAYNTRSAIDNRIKKVQIQLIVLQLLDIREFRELNNERENIYKDISETMIYQIGKHPNHKFVISVAMLMSFITKRVKDISNKIYCLISKYIDLTLPDNARHLMFVDGYVLHDKFRIYCPEGITSKVKDYYIIINSLLAVSRDNPDFDKNKHQAMSNFTPAQWDQYKHHYTEIIVLFSMFNDSYYDVDLDGIIKHIIDSSTNHLQGITWNQFKNLPNYSNTIFGNFVKAITFFIKILYERVSSCLGTKYLIMHHSSLLEKIKSGDYTLLRINKDVPPQN